MTFNFNQASVRSHKAGSKVHVIKALICLKEDRPRKPSELDVLTKAIDYIKSLEAEVSRQQSSVVVENFSVRMESESGTLQKIGEAVGRGALGRLFGGKQWQINE